MDATRPEFPEVERATSKPKVELVDMEEGDPRLVTDLYPVLHELRFKLTEEQLQIVYREGYPQGLRFTGAYEVKEDESRGHCVGVAGWRIMYTAFEFKKLFVDDLVTTASARSLGVGNALVDGLKRKAKSEDCAVFDLLSGCQRDQAHKFYFREGLVVKSFHFSTTL